MMLLAAIVLLVAFLSLTTLVARVSVVEQETGRDVSPTILREAEAVRRAIEALDAAGVVNAGMRGELEDSEGQRGYFASVDCVTGVLVEVVLSDARSAVQFQVDVAACA